MSAAPVQQQAPSPPSPFVEDDSKPPLDDLVRRAHAAFRGRALALALTACADACARPQLTDGDVPTAAEAVLLRPPGCLPTTALPPKR